MTEAEWLESSDPERMLAYLCGNRGRHIPDFRYATTGIPSNSKLRLFACACCRRHARVRFYDDPYQAVLMNACDIAEDAADGLRELPPWRDATKPKPPDETAFIVHDPDVLQAATDILTRADADASRAEANFLRDIVCRPYWPANLRQWVDAFGGRVGFKSKLLSTPQWLTPLVLSLAQGAYDERRYPCPTCKREAYIYNQYGGRMDCQTCQAQGWIDNGTLDSDRLIILADALEEAGCDKEFLLRHLRGWEPDWREMPRGEQSQGTDMVRVGWVKSTNPHVKGCWALDLILGKE